MDLYFLQQIMAKRWKRGRTTTHIPGWENEAPKRAKPARVEPPDAKRKRWPEPFFQPCVFCGTPVGLCLGTGIIQRSSHLCHRCFDAPAGRMFRKIDCNKLVEHIAIIEDAKLEHHRNPHYVSPQKSAAAIVRWMRQKGVPSDGIAPGKAQIAVPVRDLPPPRQGSASGASRSTSAPRRQPKATELDEPVIF